MFTTALSILDGRNTAASHLPRPEENMRLPPDPPPLYYLVVRDIRTGDLIGKKIGPHTYAGSVEITCALLRRIDIATQYVDTWIAKD